MVKAVSLTDALGVNADLILRKTAERTGTGSTENVAHNLKYTPTFVLIVMQEGGVAGTLTYGAHDSTNMVVTVPSGMNYVILYS